MKHSIIKNRKKFIAIIGIMGIWQVIAMCSNPLVFPSPLITLKEVFAYLGQASFYSALGASLFKLLIAMSITIIIGGLAGIIFGIAYRAKPYIDPLIDMMQSVPPIAWIGIAIVWLGINNKPAIFVIVVATLPIMFITVYEGYRQIDTKLLEMAKIYNVTQKAIILNLIIPALKPAFKLGILTSFGLGWKLTIMAEVLISINGLGNVMANARMNFQVEKILAIAIILVLVWSIIQGLINFMFNKGKRKNAHSI